MPRNKKNDVQSNEPADENEGSLLDASDFPDDGSEPETDEGGDDFNQDDPEPEQPEPVVQEAPPPPPRPRRGTLRARAPRAPRAATRKPRARTVTTRTTTIEDDGAGETQTASSDASRPSILKLLGGRTTGDLTIKRLAVKGRLVGADDTGLLPGTWADAPELADVIRSRFGGGRYLVTGYIPGAKDPVSETLDLPGESLPLVEQQERDFSNGDPFIGGDTILDDEEWVRKEQQWYRWIPEKKTYIWTRAGDPTVPMPNHGLPPGVSSVNTGADWWKTTDTTDATKSGSSEISELKALFLQQMNDRKDREAAEARRIEAEERRRDREAAERKADIERRETEERRRMDREEAARKAEFDRREADRKEELDRLRREDERRERERKEDAEKRESERKSELERREREAKDARERDDARRADERALQERMFNMMMTSAKQDPTGSLKNLLGLASGMRDLLGMGGEKSELSEKIELVRVGTEMVANNVLPALADVIGAWRHGRPADEPQQIEQDPNQPEPQQLPGPAPEASQQPNPQPAPAPRTPVKELSTAHLLDLVNFLTTSYKSGLGPKAAFVSLQGFAAGRSIPFPLVKDSLSKLTVAELDGGLARAESMIPAGLPIRNIVVEARAVLATPDARTWFTTFLNVVAGREAKPQAPPAAPTGEEPKA